MERKEISDPEPAFPTCAFRGVSRSPCRTNEAGARAPSPSPLYRPCRTLRSRQGPRRSPVLLSVVLVLGVLGGRSLGFEDENDFGDLNSESSYYPSPAPVPLNIAPTSSSSLNALSNPAYSPSISSAPNTYFISGLANTIRRLNSTLVSLKSRKEPFQLHFRTACSFGSLVYDDKFILGISPEGNLTYSTKTLDLNTSISMPEDTPSSIYENVADGSWHSLTFNGSVILLNPDFRSGEGPEFPGPIVTFGHDPVLRFFDGFVGCVKLTSVSGASIPSGGEDYYPSAPGNFTFTDYFQFDSTPPYHSCSDLTLDLSDVHHCPDPVAFVLCDKCGGGGRCEVIEEDEVSNPSNHCFCPEGASGGKYCESMVSEPQVLSSNDSPVQVNASEVNTTSSRPGNARSGSENFTTPFPPTVLYPSPESRNTTVADRPVPCPCQHGGVCLSTSATSVEVGVHICSCEGTGFYGERCEIENMFCRSSPCVHGICQPKGDSYQCYCLPGFAGSNCDVNFNECLSNPCGRNGECQDDVNNYRCHCHPGYTGAQCETEIDECLSNPCRNNGICVDAVANYTCNCVPGFEGHSCETNIDECLSSPCRNNGVCIDEINKFSCNCSDTGFEGFYCDREINECDEEPCHNGGTCEDGIKMYTCHCHSAYNGSNCEVDIDECGSSPCRNNGTCLERSNASLYNSPADSKMPPIFMGNFNHSAAEGFECICPPGFEGFDCSVDIDECAPRPCYNGRCVDLFNQFRCECHDGYKGNLCEIEIDECESSPCKRGECIDKVGDFACVCPEGYGAQDCSVELIGCSSVLCFNNGTCSPTYVNKTHGHKCLCAPGWAGSLCQDSTTLSFGGSKGGYAEVVSDDERFRSRYAMSFRFRTTLSEVLIAVGQGSTYFMLTLSGGKLNLQSSLLNSLKGISSGNNVSNADWHRAWVSINETHIALGVNQEQTIHPIQTEPEQPVETGFNTTVLGGATSGLSALTNLPSFVGCIQDISINDKRIVPAEDAQRLIKYDPALVEIGCKRTEQCSPSPCGNSGTCTDLWTKFECKCPRPFLGEKCEHEYTAGTFGHESTNLSIIEIHIPVEVGRKFDKSFEISMFVRTREPRGTIFLLKDERQNGLFLETYVEEDGQLGVLARLDEGREETYKVGGLAINDGEPHLISIQKERGLVKINVNGTEHFRKSLPLKPSQVFNPSVMYIGGVPGPADLEPSSSPSPTPEGSSAVPLELEAQTSEPIPLSESRTARAIRGKMMEPFKGVIQDVRVNLSEGSGGHHAGPASLNRYVVEFFPLNQVNKSYLMGDPLGQVIQLGNVLEGVVSDDACRVDPCLNGGTCRTTWNDFQCLCTEEYDGKMCSHLLPCAIVRCPTGSTCRNLYGGNGFECEAEAAFDGKGLTSPHYHLRTTGDPENLTFNEISFRYRSQRGGSVLHIADRNGSSLRIGLDPSEDSSTDPPSPTAYLSLVLNGNRTTEKLSRALNGDWHTLSLTLDPANPHFSLRFDGVERKGPIGPLVPPQFLRSLLTAALPEIIVGSSIGTEGRSAYDVDHAAHDHAHPESLHEDYYRGCLDFVQLGTYRLPFVSSMQLLVANPGNSTLVQTTAPTAFYMDGSGDGTPLTLGCVLCYDEECQNGGHCESPTQNYDCSCGLGFQGKLCEVNINECEPHNDCAFGAVCVDQVANYTCNCSLGYTGWLCDMEINECDPNPCQSRDLSAVCEDRIGSYVCSCSEDWSGPNCSNRKLASCRDDPCENGAMCLTVTTRPDGTNFSCACPLGYTGLTCGKRINYCENLSCLNGGTCENKKAGADCRCAPGWDGPKCEKNINECLSDPCLNGGLCVDGINRFDCNCTTGWTGLTCDADVDECSDYRYFTQCPPNSTCYNTAGSYDCVCHDGLCGHECDMADPCPSHLCENDGVCEAVCEYDADPYPKCQCMGRWTGTNCTERLVSSTSSPTINVLLIVIPVLTAFLLAAVIAGVILVRMARKKRATRGVYSPSQQEYCNPRVELDNVMKPPPEERLI